MLESPVNPKRELQEKKKGGGEKETRQLPHFFPQTQPTTTLQTGESHLSVHREAAHPY